MQGASVTSFCDTLPNSRPASCQVGDVGHRVLVGISVCGKVSKIGDAGNESAIIFAAVLVAREP